IDPDRYTIPQPAGGTKLAVGRLSMQRDGFGFVVPEADSLDERLKARLAGDIFIPPPAVGSAMHGDRVVVEIGPIRPDGRAEGRIVHLIGRAHATVVGTFHYGSRRNYVTPIDQKIAQEIIIPPALEYPEGYAADNASISESGHTKSPPPRDRPGTRAERHGSRQARARDRVFGAEAARRTDWQDLE